MQQRGVKPCMLPLLIALTCAWCMKRAHLGDVKIFKKLIEVRQIRRSYC
jgi:hypothetical protein